MSADDTLSALARDHPNVVEELLRLLNEAHRETEGQDTLFTRLDLLPAQPALWSRCPGPVVLPDQHTWAWVHFFHTELGVARAAPASKSLVLARRPPEETLSQAFRRALDVNLADDGVFRDDDRSEQLVRFRVTLPSDIRRALTDLLLAEHPRFDPPTLRNHELTTTTLEPPPVLLQLLWSDDQPFAAQRQRFPALFRQPGRVWLPADPLAAAVVRVVTRHQLWDEFAALSDPDRWELVMACVRRPAVPVGLRMDAREADENDAAALQPRAEPLHVAVRMGDAPSPSVPFPPPASVPDPILAVRQVRDLLRTALGLPPVGRAGNAAAPFVLPLCTDRPQDLLPWLAQLHEHVPAGLQFVPTPSHAVHGLGPNQPPVRVEVFGPRQDRSYVQLRKGVWVVRMGDRDALDLTTPHTGHDDGWVLQLDREQAARNAWLIRLLMVQVLNAALDPEGQHLVHWPEHVRLFRGNPSDVERIAEAAAREHAHADIAPLTL